MNNKSANRQMHKQSQHRLKPVYAAVLLAFAVQTAQTNPTGLFRRVFSITAPHVRIVSRWICKNCLVPNRMRAIRVCM
jgi:hypothetical protein